MIRLVPTKKSRVWDLVNDKGECLYQLNLTSTSLPNKYEIVQKLFDELNDGMFIEIVDGDKKKKLYFSKFFEILFTQYLESNRDAQMIYDNVPIIFKFAEKYIESKNIDFSEFVNTKKATKTSIMFLEDDLKAISISSTCLKIYSVFSYDNFLKLPKNLHKQVYHLFTHNCYKIGTISKVFKLMQAKIYSSYLRDKYLWDLSIIKSDKTPDSYINEIFIYLMKELFSTLDPTVNPIPFLNQVVDGSVKWLMASVHNPRIIYGDVFGGTESIYGASHTQHSLAVYACNDVIGKVAEISLELLRSHYNLSPFEQDLVEKRIEEIDEIYPYMKLFALPIISNVLEIPYKHLLNMPPKHCMIISIFMRHLATGILDDRFPYLMNFLVSSPKTKLVGMGSGTTIEDFDERIIDVKKGRDKYKNVVLSSTRSSYKLRNLEFVINDKSRLFGFNAPKFRFEILSCICGVLAASKKGLVSVITRKDFPKITHLDLEEETTNFFNRFYANKLKPEFEEMKTKVDDEYL